VPAAHWEHWELQAAEVVPHRHAVHVEAPLPEYVLARQLVHVLDPRLAAKVPAVQGVQVAEPGTEVYPTGQGKHEPGIEVRV